MKKFTVGQIVYVLQDVSRGLIPVMITEEVVKNTLQGSTTTYNACYGSKEQRKTIDLSKVKGNVFESIESAQAHLLQEMKKVASAIIKRAQDSAASWYEVKKVKAVDDEPLISVSVDRQQQSSLPQQMTFDGEDVLDEPPSPIDGLNRVQSRVSGQESAPSDDDVTEEFHIPDAAGRPTIVKARVKMPAIPTGPTK